MRFLPGCLLLFFFALPAAAGPRLLVVISVDQMRADTLTRFAGAYTSGLKRFLERGRRFEGRLDHAGTETGPGHSTMLTGCRPARTGIVANSWLDPATLERIYCVEDPASPVYGAPKIGRSPKNLLRDTLGDWMKRADPRTKIYAVSAKDRAAILMAGRSPDGVFWLDKRRPGFTTSRYYRAGGLPGWLVAFNGDGWFAALPASWTYKAVPGLRADDDPRESSRYGRASPHPLRQATVPETIAALYHSPFADAWTLRLAARLVDRYDLGGDEACDLLCISLSATDTVGHLYGPFSQEIRDTELRLDRELGRFLDGLDARRATYLAVLTADHGVLPMDTMKRIDSRRLLQSAAAVLKKRFGVAGLFKVAGSRITIDRVAAARAGADPGVVAQVLAGALRAQDGVGAVFSAAQLESGSGGGALLALARRSYRRGRSGDLYLIPAKNCYLSPYATGTGHGSPYLYDREIPLIFLGPGCAPGSAGKVGRTIDIAPTLAGRVGVSAPSDLDGQPLPLH